MRCLKCNKADSKVIFTGYISHKSLIKRRRQCMHCDFRWTTYERSKKEENKNLNDEIYPEKE